ncbi:MAG: aminodeoxychorismate lyase [Methylophaga sp.]|nr:aminodeoxychorismate lyase [Methylophaga sp.]
MILVNGKADNRISISDRAIQYGDGLFETIAYRNGQLEFVDTHLMRLAVGCKRLAIPFRQLKQLKEELSIVLTELAEHDAVIKIIISRGSGGRGYLADPSVEPTRIISTYPLPTYPANYQEIGVTARICQQRLSENTSLAGIKHLNRLEQVLARTEWHDPEISEGIMLDQHENVIEGTMSNLFIVKAGELFTAELNKSGVAGIIRAEILDITADNNIPCTETIISKSTLADADEVFVCNSIIGIWPVTCIYNGKINYNYPVGKITRQLQNLLSN